MDYKKSLALNEIQNLDQVEFGFDLYIIDLIDMKESIQTLNDIRNVVEDIPVLWVIDPLQADEALEHLKSMNGKGRIKIEYRNAYDPQALMQAVALLIYPDLPTKRMTMDLFIPIFNEAHRIKYVREFAVKLRKLNALGYPYISIYFIDDGSNDDSNSFINDMIDAYHEENDAVDFKVAFHLIPLHENTRKAGTYMEAFRIATSDIIIFADADNAFNLDDISKLINIIEQGYYDIVIGTKDKTAEDRPFIRDVISTIKRIMTKPLLPKGVTDSQTGLKLFRGSVVKHILSQLDTKYGLAIDLKIIHVSKRLNLRVLEVPVYFKDREGSHIDVLVDSVKFVKNIIKIAIGM